MMDTIYVAKSLTLSRAAGDVRTYLRYAHVAETSIGKVVFTTDGFTLNAVVLPKDSPARTGSYAFIVGPTTKRGGQEEVETIFVEDLTDARQGIALNLIESTLPKLQKLEMPFQTRRLKRKTARALSEWGSAALRLGDHPEFLGILPAQSSGLPVDQLRLNVGYLNDCMRHLGSVTHWYATDAISALTLAHYAPKEDRPERFSVLMPMHNHAAADAKRKAEAELDRKAAEAQSLREHAL